MKIKKLIWLSFAALIAASCNKSGTPKYVFYVIGDGMGVNQVYLTEEYNQVIGSDTPTLSFTSFPVKSFINTASASSLVTDSAAGGTALSCGVKTNNGYLGVDTTGARLTSISEAAAEAGMKVGIVTSVGLNHATPGAFYGHRINRNQYDDILCDLDSAKVDFIAGSTFLINNKEKQPAAWAEDFAGRGYNVCYSQADVDAVESGRIIMLSDNIDRSTLPYKIDHKDGNTTLKDYVAGCLSYLTRIADKKGFFMMIEGGKIDYACHSNDAATMVNEVMDMDEALAPVLEFYRQHPKQTLIVITADHETGALAMSTGQYRMDLVKLKSQRESVDKLADEMRTARDAGKVSWDDMKELLKNAYGFWDTIELTEDEEARLKEAYDKTFANGSDVVKHLYSSIERIADEGLRIINRKALVGWCSDSHSGARVPLFAIGAGSEDFAECSDNTDVPHAMATLLGVQLSR